MANASHRKVGKFEKAVDVISVDVKSPSTLHKVLFTDVTHLVSIREKVLRPYRARPGREVINGAQFRAQALQ